MTDYIRPPHYGGQDNAYETFKVLEAWMTPIEVMGFYRGTAIKYLSRVGNKTSTVEGMISDLAKAQTYCAVLGKFLANGGNPLGRLYWCTVSHEPDSDLYALLDKLTDGEVVLISSNREPYVRFVFTETVEDGDGGTSRVPVWFDTYHEACAHQRDYEDTVRQQTARSEPVTTKSQKARIRRRETLAQKAANKKNT